LEEIYPQNNENRVRSRNTLLQLLSGQGLDIEPHAPQSAESQEVESTNSKDRQEVVYVNVQ